MLEKIIDSILKVLVAIVNEILKSQKDNNEKKD